MEATRTFQFLGLTFNVGNMISGVIVAAIVLGLVFICSRHLQMKPSGKQNLLEAMVDFTNGIVKSTCQVVQRAVMVCGPLPYSTLS
ncbi:hypothetical protein [Fructilactobacillus florum]|uniref:hypothetical protein n=1 Tax=Fructilactobacillus florum TaxID=640331 RepID=UPI000A62D6D5|nr:hypothetical protein [Fructilactobacillus florum]